MTVGRVVSFLFVFATCTFGDEELKLPDGRWPTDLTSTLDDKSVVLVGGGAMHGGGKIDLVDVETFHIVKTAPLPEGQSASSITIVPCNGSARGVAVVAMGTQMIGVPDSIYMVSLDDASFGKMIWKWTPPVGDLFGDHNAAIGKDASGRYIYVASGNFKNRKDNLYSNKWWLHVLDVAGSVPRLVQTIDLPDYVAKSYYEGFGVFPSAEGNVIVNSNIAGVVGAPIVLVENAASSSYSVRNITFTLNEDKPVFINVLAWDTTGKGFYVDAAFVTPDGRDLKDVRVHLDERGGVIASSDVSKSAERVSHEFYGKAYVNAEDGMIYYPTHNNGDTMLQGLVAAFDAKSVSDSSRYEHVGVTYWPMAVTVAGGDLWVAWNSVEKGTLNRYSLAGESHAVILV